MNLKSKKGYALVMALLFVIILAISSLGLYRSVEYLAKEIRIKETKHIRGYYYGIAGLRYAAILLRDPDLALPCTIPRIENSDDDDFFEDIGVDSSSLAITITKIIIGDHAGDYEVKATYTY